MSSSPREVPGRREWRSGRLLVLVLASVLATACGGPVGPFAGGRLSGEEAGWPADWDALAAAEEIQLETGPDDPYSVNLWAVVVDGDPWVVSSLLMGPDEPEERRWVRNVEQDDRVRLRVDGVVHPARAVPVDDADVVGRVFEAFLAKYPSLDAERRSAARYFRLVPRSG